MGKSARKMLLVIIAAVGVSVFGGVSVFRRTAELRRAAGNHPRFDRHGPASTGAPAAPGKSVEAGVVALRPEQEGDEGGNRASDSKVGPLGSAGGLRHREHDGALQQDNPVRAAPAAPGTAHEGVVAFRQEQEEKKEGDEGEKLASEAKTDPSSSAAVAVAHHNSRVQQGAARRDDLPHYHRRFSLYSILKYFLGIDSVRVCVVLCVCEWRELLVCLKNVWRNVDVLNNV